MGRRQRLDISQTSDEGNLRGHLEGRRGKGLYTGPEWYLFHFGLRHTSRGIVAGSSMGCNV